MRRDRFSPFYTPLLGALSNQVTKSLIDDGCTRLFAPLFFPQPQRKEKYCPIGLFLIHIEKVAAIAAV